MDFKQILLNNAAYLEEELEIFHVLEFFVNLNKISPEERDRITSEKSRRTRVKLFLLQIITRFGSSTYHDFKLSLQDQNRHILQHLEECENFKGWYKLLTCDDSIPSYFDRLDFWMSYTTFTFAWKYAYFS